jgi:DNA mismatch repair protein MutS2
MRCYPETAFTQLEFDKISELLTKYTRTQPARERALQLRIHTKKEYIIRELSQTHEFLLILQQQQYFPGEFTAPLHAELKLLGIAGAVLVAEQWLLILRLCENLQQIFRWMDQERRQAFPGLAEVLEGCYDEKKIPEAIQQVIDDTGAVKDTASPDLQRIRQQLYKKRQELRRIFERVVGKLQKAGFSADIAESFSNGRRVVAVFSEHKRMVKGIYHGESDSRKTAFIEPEETIELNNDLYSLENEERQEIHRIFRELTADLSVFAPLLREYYRINADYDFIRAKARLAMDMDAHMPVITDKAQMKLMLAHHPLLLLYNRAAGKKTIPLNITLHDDQRILVISGPNAGGKTVTMKTAGLLQLMVQSGLLVPVHPDSEMGIFRQLFIHMGDTQNLAFELSTYSSHLLHMKYFMENANGKTLFFIDELGSGSDPSLGGAFAEVILEELSHKHALGIVTTHYLNLKVMANHTRGIVNAAMLFDEANLQPLYQLVIGKPGSSYTFAIAERIGLPKHLIGKARKLVDENHFSLDKLLNRTERDLQVVQKERVELQKLLKENAALKKQMEATLQQEKHRQDMERLREQNKMNVTQLAYLKDMERKLKQVVTDYKKTENKQEVIRNLKDLLFGKKESVAVKKMVGKVNKSFRELPNQPIEVGMLVKLTRNHQVGTVKEVRGKRAIVLIGQLPMNVNLSDLVPVEKIIEVEPGK